MVLWLDLDWYNKIYGKGGRPSLEHDAELIRKNSRVVITERTRKNRKLHLDEILFAFERSREYNPGLKKLVELYLIVHGPDVVESKDELKRDFERYDAALEKHKNHPDYVRDLG